uniref:Uncharacterized protein n=1 Tax=Rhizophora mucronata TaxID=61149 RepID=A0A2P2PQK3_RHIMU
MHDQAMTITTPYPCSECIPIKDGLTALAHLKVGIIIHEINPIPSILEVSYLLHSYHNIIQHSKN